MALLKFAARSNYNGAIYLPGKVYEIADEPPGYVNRWLRRGVAEEVEEAGEVLPDPRGVVEPPPAEPEPVEEDFGPSDLDEDLFPEEDEEDEEDDED